MPLIAPRPLLMNLLNECGVRFPVVQTSVPQNEAELQLYRVMQRASLLGYYDTLLEMGEYMKIEEPFNVPFSRSRENISIRETYLNPGHTIF